MTQISKLLFALSIMILSVSCTRKSADSEVVFNSYVKERIQSLDPALAHDIFAHQSIMQVYEGLLHFHYLKRPLELEPLLADGMPTVSADGLTYTFKIKKGVRFQNSKAFKNGEGREVTAQDFIYSWKRLADPQVKSENYWVFRDKLKGLEEWRTAKAAGKATYDTPIEGLEATDSHTLIIRLIKPDFQLLSLLASAMTVVVAREAVEYFGPEFGSQPVGTGAFQFDSWTRGSRLTLVKNPTYRDVLYPSEGEPIDTEFGRLKDAGRKLPFVDKVVIQEIVEEQPQWLSFQKGELDTIFVPKDYLEQVIKDGKITEAYKNKGMSVQLANSTDVVYISFNTENRFLKNKKIRQAMSMAYDRAAALKMFYFGIGVAAHGPIPPTLSGYRKDVVNPNVLFNVKKAKALLVEAGYPEGKGLPEFTFELGSGHSTARQMAEFFQQHMAAIGIKVRLNINTWAQFSEKIKKKQATIFDMSWNADYPDAENFLQLFYGKNTAPGPNNSNFKNTEYDALYEKSLTLPPGDEKVQIYQKMEDILMDESPWIFNLHRVRVLLYQGWLKNYKHEYIVLDSMKYYRVDANERERLKKTL